MFILKLLVSGGLIIWVLLYSIDVSHLIVVISKLNLKLITIALGMRFFGLLVSSLRWQKVLDSQAVHIRVLSLNDSYLISSFFNLFMPTRIGGDVFRVNDLQGACGSLSKSASSVFVERFLGILVLLIFAIFASLAQISLSRKIPAIWMGLFVGISGIAILFFILYSRFTTGMIRFIPLIKLRERLASKWAIFRENALLCLSHPKFLAWGLWYSFLLQVVVILHYWIIGRAIGFSIPLSHYFFLIPVQLIILMLPSINGIGLREASSIVLFGYYGIAATDAATFGFVDLAMMLVLGFIGWLRFLSRGSKPENTYSQPITPSVTNAADQ